MLQIMRKHAGNWMIKILLGAIALAFALSWGAYNSGPQQEVAMTVNGEPITDAQLREEEIKLTENLRRQFGPQFEEMAALFKIKEQASEALIQRILLSQASQQMGIEVGEAEIRSFIKNLEVFKQLGGFDMKVYQRMLAAQRMTEQDFEDLVRLDVSVNKLMSLVVGSAQVSPLEVTQGLTSELTKVKGAYLVFAGKDYEDKVEIKEEDLKTYYENNKRRFLVPEKISLVYLNYPLANYRDQVDVRESDVSEQYDTERDRYYKPEQVHARHILFKLPAKPAQAEVDKVKARAEEVLAMAQKPDADFADLAKKYSEGPTAPRGGDLGYFGRGAMVPEFEKLAFELKKGETGLVRTNFGWHVVKAEDHKEASLTPLEQVKGEIRDRLTETQAKYLAEAAAERAFDLAAKGMAPKELAEKTGATLQETEPIPTFGPVPGLKELKGLSEAQMNLDKDQVLNVLNHADGSMVAFIKERIPESVRPMPEVLEDVRLAVKAEKAKQAAKDAAVKMLADLAKAADPAKTLLATANAKETDWLKREDSVSGLDDSFDLVQALFLLPESKPVLKEPASVGENFAVAVLTGVQPPSEDEIKSGREEFAERLLAEKRRVLQQKFVADLRASAEIKVGVQN